MNSQNPLEITGNLTNHPTAELLAEIMQCGFNGSLRLAHEGGKTIVYVRGGEVVFAVSNQRQHRIFEMLLQSGTLTKQQLVAIPEFTNDLVLAKSLQEKQILPASSLKAVFTRQIEGILRDAIGWREGVWVFSPLARIKEDIVYQIDARSLLLEYARGLHRDAVVKRFKTFNESFGRRPAAPAQINLHPEEAFLLSRFEHSALTIEEIKALSGLTDMDTLHKLYVLWLAGFLRRDHLDKAFSDQQALSLSADRFELKKQVAAPVAKTVEPPTPAGQTETDARPEADAPVKEELSLEKYLAQVENAETHYQLLDISHKATAAEIKQTYFKLAKHFHPDLFHKQADAATQSRIQHAFTEIAHAYEVLRDEETRKTYDFRLRKLLQELEKLSPEERAKPIVEQKTLTEATEIFERGFDLLMNEDYDQALPYIVRAIHLAPDVARYHAYYGKLLAMDKNQRFKAEAELQTAIKLDQGAPTFRLMLVEFFIQYNLLKRAEGELNRILTAFPNNQEARALLDSLQNK